ncbi:chemotaxis protein [Thiomonas bhubaneswarensis]|uniref:Chemotaxis signal transduction protein n=1 Tax=Thiomonas bhubaneswarensis TaxID=339866 RepID=A0A0K6I0H8_9BURK|nr:chemotaxis protein [Thiomonas bhubaneswarensis]CUA96625.1 Chemotaxis signal transduction protein [Thiomonas bhubaneswarensis]
MNSSVLQEVDERSNLAGTNKFELLLFRLGEENQSNRRELFGINVFKVREALVMPQVTVMPGAPKHVLGVANIRGQIIPVIDLPGVVGCTPKTGLNILVVTEYERSVQGFAVEEVEEIVRLEWSKVLSAEANAVGGMVTSIARLEDDQATRLALVLDVEKVLRDVLPSRVHEVKDTHHMGPALGLKPGAIVLTADDSFVARSQIEKALQALQAPFVSTKTGKEAWDRLQALAAEAQAEGKRVEDKVQLVLTDLEMPEMDGFTLTRKIKQDDRFKNIPVVIHSSLSGSANEDHARSVGADAYVAKFVADELAQTIRRVLAAHA